MTEGLRYGRRGGVGSRLAAAVSPGSGGQRIPEAGDEVENAEMGEEFAFRPGRRAFLLRATDPDVRRVVIPG